MRQPWRLQTQLAHDVSETSLQRSLDVRGQFESSFFQAAFEQSELLGGVFES
jgi:hypothetical protein